MKYLYFFTIPSLFCVSASLISAQMWRDHSSDEEDSPLLPQHQTQKPIHGLPKTVGTSEYHEAKLAHHQQKVKFHDAISMHLAYSKHQKLSTAHGVESFRSKDLMAAHNDFSEGIQRGVYLAGSKNQKRKSFVALPNPPTDREEAFKLVGHSNLKHLKKGHSKHLPLQKAMEKHESLNRKLNNQHDKQKGQSSPMNPTSLIITNFP